MSLKNRPKVKQVRREVKKQRVSRYTDAEGNRQYPNYYTIVATKYGGKLTKADRSGPPTMMQGAVFLDKKNKRIPERIR